MAEQDDALQNAVVVGASPTPPSTEVPRKAVPTVKSKPTTTEDDLNNAAVVGRTSTPQNNANPAYTDPTADKHPYLHALTDLVIHPLKSVDNAHEYYANQSKGAAKEMSDESVAQPEDVGPINNASYIERQFTHPNTGTVKRAGSGAGDLALMPIDVARSAYHAVVDAPKSPEEEAVAAGGSPYFSGPGEGRVALAAKRLIWDPQTAEYKKAQEEAENNHLSESMGHSVAAGVPLIGPMVAQLGEQAGQGDLSGAATKGVLLIAAPDVIEESKPGGRLPGAAAAGEDAFPATHAVIDAARVPAAGIATRIESAITPKNAGRAGGALVVGGPSHLIPVPGSGVIGTGIGATVGGSLVEGALGKERANAPIIKIPERVLSTDLRDEVELKRALASTEKAKNAADKAVQKLESRVGLFQINPYDEIPEQLKSDLEDARRAQRSAYEDHDAVNEEYKRRVDYNKQLRNANRGIVEPTTAAPPISANSADTQIEDITAKPGARNPKPPTSEGARSTATPRPTAGYRPINVKGPGEVAPELIRQPARPSGELPSQLGSILLPEAESQGVLIRPQPLLTEGKPSVGEGAGFSGSSPPEAELITSARPSATRLATNPASDELIPTAKPASETAPQARGTVSDELRATLKKNGYSDTQINRMRPDEAKAHSEVNSGLWDKTNEPIGKEGRRTTDITREQLGNLSDANLRKVAKSAGVDPSQYDFSMRDAKRHRVEREQLTKELTEQLHPEEVLRHGDNAANFEHNPDQSSASKAARAAKLFKNRLSGSPLDPYGNPTVSGESQGHTSGPTPLNADASTFIKKIQHDEGTGEGTRVLRAIPEAKQVESSVADIAKRFGAHFDEPEIEYEGGRSDSEPLIKTAGTTTRGGQLIPTSEAESRAVNNAAQAQLERLRARAERSEHPTERAVNAHAAVKSAKDAVDYWANKEPEATRSKIALARAQLRLSNETRPSVSGSSPALDLEASQSLRDLASDYLKQIGAGEGPEVDTAEPTRESEPLIHTGDTARNYTKLLQRRGFLIDPEVSTEGQDPAFEPHGGPAFSTDAAAEQYLKKLIPDKQTSDIEALASAKNRLGLDRKPNPDLRTHSFKGIVEAADPKAVDRLAERANTKATFRTDEGELLNKHTVELTDARTGKSTGRIIAQSETDNPNLWTVKWSRYANEGKGVGTDFGYAKLADEAAKAGARLQGDATISESAKGAWARLKKMGYDVRYTESGRPYIDPPKLSAKPLPRAMGGGTEEPYGPMSYMFKRQ